MNGPIHNTMDTTNLLIISLLLLDEEENTDDENQRRRERWAAMSQVENEERTRSIPRISLPEPKLAMEYCLSFKE